MGKALKHPPVKLIIGFIYKERAAFDKARALLIRKFGPVDFESRQIPFTHTDYYGKEFGKNLTRCFLSFAKLIPAQGIAAIKLFTNRIEGSPREINIDPGYLELPKLVLASTKDFYHRVYLNKGIFAELTLFFRDKTFQPFEWTYPDYRSAQYIEIFNHIRHIYEGQIRSSK